MDYFSLFGLPIRYQVDMQQLRLLFQDLQRRYHPDRFVNSPQKEKVLAVKRSAVINQAWQVLRNPIARAEYLLSLRGFDSSNEYSACNKTFLVEQFELREELDNIEKEKNKIQLESFIKRVKEMFDIWNMKMIEQFDAEKWDVAAETVARLRFIDQLRKNAEKLEEKLVSFKF